MSCYFTVSICSPPPHQCYFPFERKKRIFENRNRTCTIALGRYATLHLVHCYFGICDLAPLHLVMFPLSALLKQKADIAVCCLRVEARLNFNLQTKKRMRSHTQTQHTSSQRFQTYLQQFIWTTVPCLTGAIKCFDILLLRSHKFVCQEEKDTNAGNIVPRPWW
jgi:hypothetical protein